MGIIRDLVTWAQNDFLADSESESDRQGYLSWRGEWHAAAWGFAAGFLAFATGNIAFLGAAVGWLLTRSADRQIPGYIPYPSQLGREPLYVLGHAVPGSLIGLAVSWLAGPIPIPLPI